MNTTTGGSENLGGFGYGIGVSAGILLLITTITVTSYYCTRNNTSMVLPQRNPPRPAEAPPPDEHIEVGIDEATLTSYPKMLYSEAKKNNHKDSTVSCCSICLGNYKNSDTLRLLPDCGHLFHLKCVDPWLRLHPTCPVCRTSPLPSPMSTPLAEVVPLATRPGG